MVLLTRTSLIPISSDLHSSLSSTGQAKYFAMANMKNSTPKKAFPFLSLPLEVRRKIYLVMRSWPSKQHHALLCVSKQMLSEAKESYAQRALICTSEDDLISKVYKSIPVVLNSIQTLVLTFDDYCSSEESHSLLLSATEEPACGVDEPHFSHLQSVVVCLARLPNITELAFLQSKDSISDGSLGGILPSLTTWLSKHYRQIESLKLAVGYIGLDFISSLSNLQSLDSCAYSLTAATEAAQVFHQLDHLATLTLTRSAPRPTYNAEDSSRIKRSIDGEVLRSMKPLKNVNLFDNIDMTQARYEEGDPRRPLKIIDEDVFNALREKHGDSIENLHIKSSDILTPLILQAMKTLLESATALKTLRLSLIDADIDNLENLPKSLRSIDIAVQSNYMPPFVEADLHSIHSALPNLQDFQYTVYKRPLGRLLCHFGTSAGGKKKWVSWRRAVL